jgi:hypothetical protein
MLNTSLRYITLVNCTLPEDQIWSQPTSAVEYVAINAHACTVEVNGVVLKQPKVYWPIDDSEQWKEEE